MTTVQEITSGQASLGIELGSTRIKASLIGPDHAPIASGSHSWENQLHDGLWTYSLESVWAGLQACVSDLQDDVRTRYGVELTRLAGLGVSAMMHGYLAFDSAGELLTPFRTWRNTNTGPAASKLTDLLGFNIPLRWSIAHYYQAMVDAESHVPQVDFLTTLAGYVHWQLTGQKVIGVGDASGMFPIDSATCDYDAAMVTKFDSLAGVELRKLLPKVLPAGADAGTLTPAGAALLDPSGKIQAGVPVCPPEGDAGTGMVATNSIAPRTGNVSAGTSIFLMVVLERALKQVHHELDIVTTPAGHSVAMVHCNNGASELDAWVGTYREMFAAAGHPLPTDEVFEAFFRAAMQGEPDGGGLLAYNYLAGEPITNTVEGRPLVVRSPESRLTLANLARTQIYGVFGTLALGMKVLAGEGVGIDTMFAHGGLFKTAGVAQRFLAAALEAPVAVGESASEGGAWGIAVLAAYRAAATGEPLDNYLSKRVFADSEFDTAQPDAEDVAGFRAYLAAYEKGLDVVRAAVTAV